MLRTNLGPGPPYNSIGPDLTNYPVSPEYVKHVPSVDKNTVLFSTVVYNTKNTV